MAFTEGAKARDVASVSMQRICTAEIVDPAGNGVTPGGRCQLPEDHHGYHRIVRGSQVIQWLDASQFIPNDS